MPDLVIYGIPQSTYVRSVRMACIEKGVPYRLDPVMPQSEALKTRHPFGKIPAIEHDGFALYETSAILRYIDEAFDGPRLTPDDPKRRARMEQWISVVNAYCDGAMVRRLLLPYSFPRTPDGKPDRTIIDKAAEEARHQVAVIDAALDPGPYLLGAELSLADLLLCPILYYLWRTPEGEAMMGAARNLPRASEAMRARRSFQETVPPPPEKRG
jgi:glutathione S-transferase